jgi:HK97 family phage portal protein
MALVLQSGGIDVELDRPLPWPSPRHEAVDLFGLSGDYAALYRAQPNVRKVVGFLARNIASLELHAFARVSDAERRRMGRDTPLVRTLLAPTPDTTPFRFWRALVSDLGIFDRYLAVKVRQPNGLVALRRIPPRYWRVLTGDWLEPRAFELLGRTRRELDASEGFYLRGYTPDGVEEGVSPIETLRVVLADEHAAQVHRRQMWRNGGRVTGVITRPREAGRWSDGARERFREGWRASYAGNGAVDGGGTPILEDGMTFTPAAFSPHDAEYVAGRIFNATEVANAYFIPPPMVGLLEHATFSNITEQHKMLYQDTLGPWLTELEQEVERQVVPELVRDPITTYVEFNLSAKLKGTFEEQAAVLSTSVGAPFLTRNEGRARLNLPPLEGGDELITPLNVVIGGLASPRDTAPDGGALAAPPPRALEAAPADRAKAIIARLARRQAKAIRNRHGAHPDAALSSLWDRARWDRELTADLEDLGLERGDAVKVTRAFNDLVEDRLEAALADPDPPAAVAALCAALPDLDLEE